MVGPNPLLKLDVQDTAFGKYVRDLRGHWRFANKAMEGVNKRSLEWMANRAAKNLQAATTRDPDPRHDRLADLIVNPLASSANADGFMFLIHARVELINARIAAYYRVIEGRAGTNVGTWYWVRRTHGQRGPLRFSFRGTPSAPDAKAPRTQAGYAIGAFETVFINPIPAYHYALRAEESFIKAGLYSRWANAALKDLGVKR